MSFPWPSFGSFIFQRDEWPMPGTDIGWLTSPSRVRQRPLGSSRDVIALTAIGSAERSFEVLLTQDRLDELKALVDTEESFTDWARPVPLARDAYLLSVDQSEEVLVMCPNPEDQGKRWRTRIILVSRDIT